jgi:uncharacterized pyridoxamine 5'-phosphate oxidase family protein
MNEVVKFLNANPVQYLATVGRDGKAVFENNMAVKEACMNNPIVKGQYQNADNPIFEVFYLEGAKAVIADFSGNPPAEYSL